MKRCLHVLLLGVPLALSSAFSQSAPAEDAPRFKSQLNFLTSFAPTFDARTKDSSFLNFSNGFHPGLELSWRTTFDYKQINIYTRMYVVGSAHNDTTSNAKADGFYYRFDRGYVTYTPLKNVSIRWGLTSTSSELVGDDHIGEMGTNSYADILNSLFEADRDLAVYFNYSPTDFLTIKHYLQAPPFTVDAGATSTGGNERRSTLGSPAVGILQPAAFANDIDDNWNKQGKEAGTGVSPKERDKQKDVMKRLLVTPIYGVGFNFHFLEKALQVQITYKGTTTESHSFMGWVQYHNPDQYYGVALGGGFANNYLFVKGQNLGVLDTHLATYFGEKKQHHVYLGNGLYFAHLSKHTVYGGASDFTPTGTKRDYLFYKLQLEATFSVFAENPDLFQVSLGYYLDVPPKNVVDSASGKKVIAKHTVEVSINNFI